MSYHEFCNRIDETAIKTIFELGSRDLKDAIKLIERFNCNVYAFECNPDCLIECEKQLSILEPNIKDKLFLIKKAVCISNGEVTFYPFDLEKYDNMGASSLLKIDFSSRGNNDEDFNKENPQKEVKVEGIRLDTFLETNAIQNIDLLCIDLQGYELNALKSLGEHLHKVKYIITECSIKNTYVGGADFIELDKYLNQYNFKYIMSNTFETSFPDLKKTGFVEFDALYINTSAFEQ